MSTWYKNHEIKTLPSKNVLQYFVINVNVFEGKIYMTYAFDLWHFVKNYHQMKMKSSRRFAN